MNKLYTHSVLNKDATKLTPEPNSSTLGRHKIKYSMHDDCWLLTTVVRPPVCIRRTVMVCVPHIPTVRSLAHIGLVAFVVAIQIFFVSFASTVCRFWWVYVLLLCGVCVCVCATGGHFALLPTLRTQGISMWQKRCLKREFVRRAFFSSSILFHVELLQRVSHSAKYKLNSYAFNLFIYVA